ncbi:MAG: hypothetical protein QM817_30160 [Archangium sp.]
MTTIRNPGPQPTTSTPSTPKTTGLAAPLQVAAPPTGEPVSGSKMRLEVTSEFFNKKDRPVSLSGAFRGVAAGPNPELPSGKVSVFQQIEAGKMQAGAEKKAPPFSATSFLAKVAKLPAAEAQAAVYGLSEADRTALVKAVASGKTAPSAEVAHALLKSSAPAEVNKIVQGLNDSTLKAVSKLAKTEPLVSVNVGLSIELAARTDWGKAHKKEVADLRQRATDPTKLSGGEKGGLGSFQDGKIQYADKLVKNPEALAAVLAHEVTHAFQGAGASGPEGEIAGNIVTAQVWAQIGDKNNSPDPSFNGYAEAWTNAGGAKGGGAAAVRERALTKYLENANQKVEERKTNPKGNGNADDTLEAWQAQAKVFSDALEKAKAGKGTAKLVEVEVKKKK